MPISRRYRLVNHTMRQSPPGPARPLPAPRAETSAAFAARPSGRAVQRSRRHKEAPRDRARVARRRIGSRSSAGSPAALTAMSICDKMPGWNMHGIAGSSRRCRRMSATTPTTVFQASWRWDQLRKLNRLPTGSSPGQNRRPISSLMTTTGGAPRARSLSRSNRPRSSGIRIASK